MISALSRASRLAALPAVAVLAAAGSAHAAAFPSKPLTIVVPAAPGGSPDILARLVGKALSEKIGQPVTIDNRPGGAGNIAAGHVARAEPDGYTLLVATDGIATNQTLFKERPYDALTSYAPVVQAINAPQIFAIRSGLQDKDLQSFLKNAKAAPGKYALASPAIGTTGQLGVLMLQKQAGITVTPVVYKSAQPALTDVLGGHADGIIVTLAPALPFIQEGRLTPIAVSTSTRSGVLPNVKTFVEQGLPDFAFGSWQGFVAPAGTPADVIKYLNQAFNDVLKDPGIKRKLEEQAFDVVGGTPEAFGALIASSVKSWGDVIRANGLAQGQQ
ncbi:Tripartite tricarboxylate transporter family receptor [Pigmentiphaga humi]|uniref:Tripartite tricarboxylate transporter family receptor n=1 Tax=Pigmentiphaga humi TaxID=2478468 RepID=A0A3P4B9B4_9BURK|nr:Tripartite tricarboxylate transporter family receptor [Pigmentiphaga humi]